MKIPGDPRRVRAHRRANARWARSPRLAETRSIARRSRKPPSARPPPGEFEPRGRSATIARIPRWRCSKQTRSPRPRLRIGQVYRQSRAAATLGRLIIESGPQLLAAEAPGPAGGGARPPISIASCPKCMLQFAAAATGRVVYVTDGHFLPGARSLNFPKPGKVPGGCGWTRRGWE